LKRKCLLVRRKEKCKREIYVDSESYKEIFDYIGQDKRHKNKFIDIVQVIMEGLHNRYLYRREGFDAETRDIHAMRFFVKQENDRIYCKEVNTEGGTKIIIMGILHLHKKSEELSHIEKAMIKKLASYEYEITK